MKTQYLMTVALGTLLAVIGQANAGEKELSKNQVPKAVIAAFEKAYPKAEDVEFEQEMFQGNAVYEVEYKENGKEYEFLYSAEGVLLQKEEEIDVANLPKPVVEAIKKAHPEAKIEEAEKLMKPDGTLTGYEVEIKEAGKEIELELDGSGKIMPIEITDDPTA
jgi:uncharacterized membrane protein YkoI